MIKKSLLILFFAALLYSCEKEENPNKIPEGLPRFNELKANYKSILTSTEQGWKASYRPSANAGTFNILMKFNDNGTVTILSDMNKYAASTQNVYYDVKGATYPELVFETFCVWHQLYEVADGNFQFRILSLNEDTVELGNVNSSNKVSEITFTRATAADYQQMTKIQGIDQLLYDFYTGGDEYFRIMQFDDFNVKGLIDFDFDRHQVYLNYIDAVGKSSTSLINFSYDENGIIFLDKLSIAGKTITRFNISQTADTSLNLTGSPLNNGIIYATDLPDFEFKGAIDQFNKYSFLYVAGYSPSLDTLNGQIQKAGAFVAAQIYHDYLLSSNQKYNALTFVIVEETGDYDFYGFYISRYLRLGEDRLRFQWSGGRDQNVTNELFEILKNYVMFFFDQKGFKIIPKNNNFIFVSYANPKNFMVVVPVF
jgi:hypothetical protein